MRAVKITIIVLDVIVAGLWSLALLIGVWLPDVVFAPKTTIAYAKLPSGYTFRVIQYWNRVDFYSTELHIISPGGQEETHTLDGDDSKSWAVPMQISESNRVVSVMLGDGRERKVNFGQTGSIGLPRGNQRCRGLWYRSVHNDLLPLVFAVIGTGLAFYCGRAPVSPNVALAIQGLPPAGLWLASFFCGGHPLQFLGPGIIFLSAPVGFAYAWHVRRQVRSWITAFAFYWGLLIGVLVAVVFVWGTILMAKYYLS